MSLARDPYHHGALRPALIEAGLRTVEERGHETLSLRELAEAVGVTRGAPYRHFKDRDALLAAVASEGFRAMKAAYDGAVSSQPDARTGLRAGARALLRFAVDRARLFRLMCSSELMMSDGADPQLRTLQEATIDDIRATIATAAPGLDPQTLRLRHLAMWSTLTGFALILQNGLLTPSFTGGSSLAEIEEAMITAAIGPL
jgi:AcrR family transcriptional regulator